MTNVIISKQFSWKLLHSTKHLIIGIDVPKRDEEQRNQSNIMEDYIICQIIEILVKHEI